MFSLCSFTDLLIPLPQLIIPFCLPACLPAYQPACLLLSLPDTANHRPSWEPSTSAMLTTWTRGALQKRTLNKESTHLPPSAHLTGSQDSPARYLFPCTLVFTVSPRNFDFELTFLSLSCPVWVQSLLSPITGSLLFLVELCFTQIQGLCM